MSENKNIAIKAYMLYVIITILMVVVVFRVVAIQYGDVVRPVLNLNDSTASVLAERLDSVAPLRGRVLTEDGSVLVTSIPLYDLHMDLKVVNSDVFSEHIDSLSWNLAQIFPERSKSEWEVKLRKAKTVDNQYFRLKNKVKYTVYQKVKNFPILRNGKFKGGFIVERYSKQYKPHGLLARRTLGYVRNNKSMVGIEGAYNTYLQGEYGTIIKKKVNGSWKPAGDYIKDPINGADVITAIDINIQDVAENELLRQLEYQGARHGSVVLMEVETGYIKAIANLTLAGDGEYYEMYNHAIGSKTVPGSTFKLATLMALMEDGKADLNQIVNAKGVYHFYKDKLSDSNNGYGYGKITLKRAFEVSSNVISQIAYDAYKADPQKFIDRLKSFGLGDALGLDLSGEPKPTLSNVGEGNWSGISIPWMSIGYEVQQTPLQTLAFYNAVANGGQFVKPLFVKEIRKDGKVVKRFNKQVIKEQVCSKETIAKLKLCLEGVVENGTAKTLRNSNFKIAGKTGTVILSKGEKGYSETSKYQASFVGYFPADNPKYSCVVVVAGPTQQIYGAKVAGTVFKEIADKVYANSLQYHASFNVTESSDVLPNVKYGCTQDMNTALANIGVNYKNNIPGQDWGVAIKKDNGINIDKRIVTKGLIPNVIGMPLNDAVSLLENHGLRVKVEGHGTVKSQNIKGGSKLIKGTQITIELR